MSVIEDVERVLAQISPRTALYRSLMKPMGPWTNAAMCDGRRHGIIGPRGKITQFGWQCIEYAQHVRRLNEASKKSGGL